VVRFFAGTLDGVRCGSADFVDRAYASGAPMGAEIGPVAGDASPHFAVLAAKDPGTAAHPGTDLQRVQIVKGWVTTDGQTHEQVYDVAGDAHNGAGVDPMTCKPKGRGAAELCTVWTDPQFDRTQRAFYYVRLLENPTCRWSTRVCKAAGVDPFADDCAAQASAAGDSFANCCLNKTNDPSVDPLVQERAWTSPVWFRPEAIGSVDGGVHFGARPDMDRLSLTIGIGGLPGGVDLQSAPLSLAVTDDDDIYRLTLPAGALMQSGDATHWVLSPTADPSAPETLTIDLQPNGEALLTLDTGERDLSAADRVDHMVEVALNIGSYQSTQTRLWRARTGSLLTSAQ